MSENNSQSRDGFGSSRGQNTRGIRIITGDMKINYHEQTRNNFILPSWLLPRRRGWWRSRPWIPHRNFRPDQEPETS